jgi:hypothetical protein
VHWPLSSLVLACSPGIPACSFAVTLRLLLQYERGGFLRTTQRILGLKQAYEEEQEKEEGQGTSMSPSCSSSSICRGSKYTLKT